MPLEHFAPPPQDIAGTFGRRAAKIWHNVREKHGGDVLGVIGGRDDRPIFVVGSRKDPEYIIKIDQRQIGHNILLLESEAVQAAADLPNRPSWLALPNYIDREDDHLVLGWVSGRRFTAAEITQNFTQAEQEQLGKDSRRSIILNVMRGGSASLATIAQSKNCRPRGSPALRALQMSLSAWN